MLAVLQQAHVMAFDHFDYQKERDEWWKLESVY